MGNPDFDPDLQTRIIMGIGGSLMTGWTFPLLWAVREPIERRVVILLTAFPVVFGLLIVTLIGVLDGIKYFFKEGGGGGFHSEMRLYPEHNIASIIMVNKTLFNSTKFLSTIDREFLH